MTASCAPRPSPPAREHRQCSNPDVLLTTLPRPVPGRSGRARIGHIPCAYRHTGITGGQRDKRERREPMAGQLHDTVPATGAARRSDAGAMRLSRRDTDGLIQCAAHYGTPATCSPPRSPPSPPGSGRAWCRSGRFFTHLPGAGPPPGKAGRPGRTHKGRARAARPRQASVWPPGHARPRTSQDTGQTTARRSRPPISDRRTNARRKRAGAQAGKRKWPGKTQR